MDKPASSVLVSLSADDTISHHVTYPERRLNLDEKRSFILIGRSSKSPAKNLVATPFNAWFNSPVMSRNHAEITANLKERTVQIRDLRSLHGTYINRDENKVGCDAQDLKDGDMLRFGIPVVRGGEVFPPFAVKVALTFIEDEPIPTQSRTVLVTEPSDVPHGRSSTSDSDSDPRALPQPRQPKIGNKGPGTAHNAEHRNQRQTSDVERAQLDGVVPTTGLFGNSSSHPIDLSSPSPIYEVSEPKVGEKQETTSRQNLQPVERTQDVVSVEPTTTHSPAKNSSFPREKFISVIKDVASLAAQAYPSTPMWGPGLGETSQVVPDPGDSSLQKQPSPNMLRIDNLPPIRRLFPQTRKHRALHDHDLTPGQDCKMSKSSFQGPHLDGDEDRALPSIRDHHRSGTSLFVEQEEQEDDDGGSIRFSRDWEYPMEYEKCSDLGDLSVDEYDNSSNMEDASVDERYEADSGSFCEALQANFHDDKAVHESDSDLSKHDCTFVRYSPASPSIHWKSPAEVDWDMASVCSAPLYGHPEHDKYDNASDMKSAALPTQTRPFPIEGLLNPIAHQTSWPATVTRVEADKHLPTMETRQAHHGMYFGVPQTLDPPVRSAGLGVSGDFGHRFGKGEYFAAREENKMRMRQWECPGPSNVGDYGDATTYSHAFGPSYRSPNIDAVPEHRRTHVGISDIVESSQFAMSSGVECGLADMTKAKRKADVMSEVSPAEYIWDRELQSRGPKDGPGAANKAAPSPVQPALWSRGTDVRRSTRNKGSADTAEHELPSSKDGAALQVSGSEIGLVDGKSTCSPPIVAQPMVPSIPCGVEESTVRPVKRARLRKLVEGLGYAALGGITVGTMVFGSLVYTAPSMG